MLALGMQDSQACCDREEQSLERRKVVCEAKAIAHGTGETFCQCLDRAFVSGGGC